MANNFVNGLVNATNYTYTENGALTHKSTKSALMDMFALGGVYRNRSDEDVILLFKNAFEESPVYALKCLFYLRDVRGGQGERRFFRVAMKWLANNVNVEHLLQYVPEFGRWDDLYCFVGTPMETAAFELMRKQLALDMECETPSLLAKWLKSENTSSAKSRMLANKTRNYFGMTHRQYRKTLAILRNRINVLERLMSENRWDEIEFDKIPSRAGLIYKNAFARRDIIQAKYEAFAKDTNSKVNAGVLYPYECVDQAFKAMNCSWSRTFSNVSLDDVNRLMVNKYWDNLNDYFNDAEFNGMAIVDTSGSMCGCTASAPINVAISLGMYCADKAKGPFHDYFMTFTNNPTFVKMEGADFCDKVVRAARAEWGGSTNIEAAFDLMLNTAVQNNCTPDEIPENLIIISDMEFDMCATTGPATNERWVLHNYTPTDTLFEIIERKWNACGYRMPRLIFWNVDARQNNIPIIDDSYVSYVSGMSPTIFDAIMSGKTGYDFMMEKLNSERYACIQ